jgi:peptidoglycan/xylan/chitin deacetylase (PgdA/CDA1 family)
MPGSFSMARFLGPRYSLRCVLFHDISETESPYTRGLGVTITPRDFEAALRFLVKHYTPVSLQDILEEADGRALPARPVLVTFDDAYASVANFAAPLCRKYEVPAVFFVNASCLDNKQLALDNLICWATNAFGLPAINRLIQALTGTLQEPVCSMAQIFNRFLPSISLELRAAFRTALEDLMAVGKRDLAGNPGLYVTRQQLQMLAASDFEIGNHTYTHIHCRSLFQGTFHGEIDRNKAELEAASGEQVRSFSVPYGSATDLTDALVEHLRRSGHMAVFLSESAANSHGGHKFRFDRISTRAASDPDLFAEIEILPRLRTVRNRLYHNGAQLERSNYIQ